jgi:hypothetical protein
MNKVALLGLASALMTVMASCGGTPTVESEASLVDPLKYLMGEAVLTRAEVDTLEQQRGTLHYDLDTSNAAQPIMRVFLERAERDKYRNSVKPAVCISLRTRTTFYDLTNFDGSDDEFDLSKGGRISDLRNRSQFSGATWDNDISSVHPADCTETILFKDYNFTGSDLPLDGNDDRSTLGSFNQSVSSVEVLP